MKTLEQRLEEAVSLHGQGKISEAEIVYNEILDTDSRHIDAMQYLGVAKLQTGNSEDGLKLLKRVISINPKNSQAHYNLGLAWRNLGNKNKALASFRRSIAIHPNNSEAQNAVGGILLEYPEKMKFAEVHIRKALKNNSRYAPALNNLALLLQKSGRIDEASNESRRAVALDPHNGLNLSTLGVILFELGKVGEAEEVLREAVSFIPQDTETLRNLAAVLNCQNRKAEAKEILITSLKYNSKSGKCLNNLAMIYADEGQLNKAADLLQQAVNLDQRDSMAVSNLGRVFLRQEKWLQAVKCFRKAFDIEPGEIARAQDFIDSLGRANLSQPSAGIMTEVDHYFKIDGLNSEPLIRMAIRYISSLKKTFPLIEEAKIGKLYISATEFQKGERLEPLCSNFVYGILEKYIIPDPDFEILLTEIRRNLLELAVEGRLPEKLSKIKFHFLCALASQCYLNEYVYRLTDFEQEMIERLARQLSDRIFQVDDTLPQAAITVFACYRPILLLGGYELLEKHQLSAGKDPFARLITLQGRHAVTEQSLKSTLSSIGTSTDDVSLKVRDQYEHSPYPRWFRTSLQKSRPLLAVLWDKFPNSMHSGVDISDTPEIMIAGCGTGLLAIETAMRYRNASITALDLSQNSLAYAKRKSSELNVDQVRWVSGDILALKGSDARYDMIDCSGVLHHMGNPIEGWKILRDLLKPRGVMRIGLYSKTARADFVQTTHDTWQKGELEWQNKIRDFRHTIFNLPDKTPLKRTVFLRDFYTLSECRDLLFHAKEHQFTLLEIQKHLITLELEFMGFDFPDSNTLDRYRRSFPDDSPAMNLANWHQFEMTDPHMFVGMYQFWVKQSIQSSST